LQIGDGPRRVLAYGFPQPDEPLGGLVVLHLARRLSQDEVLRRLACWTLLPCVDPEGARRNEGWSTVPLDLAAYARRHFRPPEGEQVEWSFPSTDACWPWDALLPEVQALQALIDALHPQVLFPLHNALLGGAYAFVSDEGASIALRLAAAWEGRALPTHRGPAELPFARALAPGVFRLPNLAEMAAALSSQGIEDPPGLLACGAPPYSYARRFGKVLTVVPELPLFTVPGIGDDRRSDLSRRQVLRGALIGDRAAFADWTALHDRAVPLLKEDNPYGSALESHRRQTPAFLEATAAWVDTDPALERPATVAEVLDGGELAAYWRLLPIGLLLQALEAEGSPGGGLLGQVHEQVSQGLEKGLADVLPALKATPVEPSVLVGAVEEIIRSAILA
jgi:hypothetical protein